MGDAMSLEGAIAANRFGLGARPGEVERASADPKAWLIAQIAPVQQPQGPDGPFRTGDQLVAEMAAYRKQRRDMKKDDADGLKAFVKQQRQILIDEMSARFDLGFTTSRPFAE